MSYDIVVVGSGSAGGVVASRLSEDERCKVLLLEGGTDVPDEAERPPPWLTLGATSGSVGAPLPDLDWGFEAEPVEAGGPRLPVQRGKVVGGTSMINGSAATRGRPQDFAAWVGAGATGWSWDDVLPYYERVEREIPVCPISPDTYLSFQRAFADGLAELGFRSVTDLNSADAWNGAFGPWPSARRNGIRQGTLVTYIRKARSRPNFTIRDRALVDRVLVENGRATGIAYVDANGDVQTVSAGRVVLSAGAYGTAPILLRSGIGPAGELKALGIETIVDLPVGRGLVTHPRHRFGLTVDTGLARRGWPDPAVLARGRDYSALPVPLDEESGRCDVLCFLNLTDRPAGTVRLRSTRPGAAPVIDHALGELVHDGSFAVAFDDFRALLETAPFRAASAVDAEAGVPLPERLRRGLHPGQHPAGGCGIGAVVDAQLRVHGVEGLTVADASAFPRSVSSNIERTCQMVGERAAAMIEGR